MRERAQEPPQPELLAVRRLHRHRRRRARQADATRRRRGDRADDPREATSRVLVPRRRSARERTARRAGEDLPFEFMLNGLRLIDGFDEAHSSHAPGLSFAALAANVASGRAQRAARARCASALARDRRTASASSTICRSCSCPSRLGRLSVGRIRPWRGHEKFPPPCVGSVNCPTKFSLKTAPLAPHTHGLCTHGNRCRVRPTLMTKSHAIYQQGLVTH